MGRTDHRQAASGAIRNPRDDARSEATPPGPSLRGATRSERLATMARAVGEGIADFLWPERCVGCDRPGTLLCEECAAELPRIDPHWACPRCGAPFGSIVCTQCDEGWTEIPRIVSALSYEGAARELVRVYKDGHERRLAPLLAEFLAEALEDAGALTGAHGSVDALAFIPSTNEAFARRGFDPMEEVARLLAPRLGLPLADVLAHLDVRDQRDLGGRERAANVRDSFVVIGELPAARLLLVDDVITTGASVRAAARVLAAHGGDVVLCASICRVW